MSGQLLPLVRYQVFNGATPLPGALLYSYFSGSSTPQPLYANGSLSTPLSNPVVADGTGAFPPMFMSAAAYRITITDAVGNIILAPTDNVSDLGQLFLNTAVGANLVFAGPSSGSSAIPTFRALVSADLPSGSLNNALSQGRLTLTSGTPVTNTNVTAATTVYFTPFAGNRIGLYNGSLWNMRTFSELSLVVPGTTNSAYDVFAYDNAGSVAIELSSAWLSVTSRFSGGAYQTLLPTQDGIYVKSTNGTAIDATRRYLGSFVTTAVSGQTEDSATNRLVYNYYNRVARSLNRIESTDSWNYTTATIRQANGSAANQIAVMQGVAEEAVDVSLLVTVSNTNATNAAIGIGEDSTTVFLAGAGFTNFTFVAASNMNVAAHVNVIPAIGYHTFTWLEYSAATGTSTWYGDGGASLLQSGLFGTWRS